MPETMQISDETYLRLFLTLFHFLWQGAAIGLVVLAGESAMRGGTPKSRYALNFGALVCMPVCVIVTFLLVDGGFWTSITDNIDQPSQQWDSNLVGLREFAGSPIAENLQSEVQSVASPTGDSSVGSIAGLAGWSSFAARPVSIGYGLCVGFLLLRVVIAICGGCRLRSTAKPTLDSRTLDIIETQAKRLGLAVVPLVSYCKRGTVPAVIGVVRPVVLLPMSLMGLETAHLSAIISHELAHIQRNDLLMNLVQRFVESFLFFHPVTWYLSRRVSVEREYCCDEIVLASGSSNVVYAQALLEIAEQGTSSITSLAATGNNTSEFECRIETILYGRPKTRLRLGRPVFLMLTCIAVAVPSVLQAWDDDGPQASSSGEVLGEIRQAWQARENLLGANKMQFAFETTRTGKDHAGTDLRDRSEGVTTVHFAPTGRMIAETALEVTKSSMGNIGRGKRIQLVDDDYRLVYMHLVAHITRRKAGEFSPSDVGVLYDVMCPTTAANTKYRLEPDAEVGGKPCVVVSRLTERNPRGYQDTVTLYLREDLGFVPIKIDWEHRYASSAESETTVLTDTMTTSITYDQIDGVYVPKKLTTDTLLAAHTRTSISVRSTATRTNVQLNAVHAPSTFEVELAAGTTIQDRRDDPKAGRAVLSEATIFSASVAP